MYFWVFNMTVMSLTLWHHFWSRLIFFFLVNTLYLPTLNKLTCLYFCQIVLTRIQIDRLHMQLRKARKTCVLSCSQSIFFQKQTHIWSVVTDQSLHFRSVVSMGHVEILLRHCLLADVVEISTQTCLLYMCCLSYAVQGWWK